MDYFEFIFVSGVRFGSRFFFSPVVLLFPKYLLKRIYYYYSWIDIIFFQKDQLDICIWFYSWINTYPVASCKNHGLGELWRKRFIWLMVLVVQSWRIHSWDDILLAESWGSTWQKRAREKHRCVVCAVCVHTCVLACVCSDHPLLIKPLGFTHGGSTVRIVYNPICLPKAPPLKIIGLNFPLLNLTIEIPFQFSCFRGTAALSRSIDHCHLSASIVQSSLLFP